MEKNWYFLSYSSFKVVWSLRFLLNQYFQTLFNLIKLLTQVSNTSILNVCLVSIKLFFKSTQLFGTFWLVQEETFFSLTTFTQFSSWDCSHLKSVCSTSTTRILYSIVKFKTLVWRNYSTHMHVMCLKLWVFYLHIIFCATADTQVILILTWLINYLCLKLGILSYFIIFTNFWIKITWICN